MEITDVSVTKLGVSLDQPKGTSRERSIDFRPAALIEIETDEGFTGIGEGYGPNPHVVEALVEHEFRDRLIGEDPLDRERLWDEMLMYNSYWSQKGQEVAAASGIDIALWDLAGKYQDSPVHDLLGGDFEDDGRVKAYASDLFWDAPDRMAEQAGEYVDQGFQAVKAHLGRGVEADRERVEAITEAIGDANLMVDVNCGYDRTEARDVGRMLADQGVYWYEEPLPPHDVAGHADLRDELEVPIATGENEFTKWGFLDLLRREATDFAMPDVMRCGGITETKKIATLCEAFSVTCTPHNYSTGVGLAATLQVVACSAGCKWLEYDTTDYPLYEGLLTSGMDIDAEGRIAVSDDPGLGVELNEATVERYRIE